MTDYVVRSYQGRGQWRVQRFATVERAAAEAQFYREVGITVETFVQLLPF